MGFIPEPLCSSRTISGLFGLLHLRFLGFPQTISPRFWAPPRPFLSLFGLHSFLSLFGASLAEAPRPLRNLLGSPKGKTCKHFFCVHNKAPLTKASVTSRSMGGSGRFQELCKLWQPPKASKAQILTRESRVGTLARSRGIATPWVTQTNQPPHDIFTALSWSREIVSGRWPGRGAALPLR